MEVLNPAIEQLLHHVHESGELQRALREKAAEEKLLQQQRERKHSNPQAVPTGTSSTSLAGAASGEVGGDAGASGGPHHRESLEGSPSGGLESTTPSAQATTPRGKAAKDKGERSPRPAAGGAQPAHGAAVPTAPTDGKPPLHRRRTSKTGKEGLGLSGKHEKEEQQHQAPSAAELAEAALQEENNRFDPLLWLSERLSEKAAGPTERYREQVERRVQEQISAAEAAAAIQSEAGGEEDAAAGGGAAADPAAAPAGANPGKYGSTGTDAT